MGLNSYGGFGYNPFGRGYFDPSPPTKLLHVCKSTSSDRTRAYYQGVVDFYKKKQLASVAQMEHECNEPRCLLDRIKSK